MSPKAINYDMAPAEFQLPVGSVIVAIGADVYDPYEMKSYGYSVSPNILTGLEFERLLNASGPTNGKILRPSDKKSPKKIAFVQCVGVRGENDRQYCSRFCCMNSVKDALLVKDHLPEIEKMTIFYSDIRCFGKGYEFLYLRSLERPEIDYMRGKPSKITECPDTGDLIIYVENTLTGRPEKVRVNMVVLASAAVPHASGKQLAEILGAELDQNGFFASKNGSSEFLSSTHEGVYLCGCAKGPEDIPESVAQGSGAAALAEKFVQDNRLELIEDEIPQVNTDGPPRIGVFLCHCGINIGGVLDITRIQDYVKTLPGVVHVQNDLFLCSDGSQKELQQKIIEKKLNRVIAAACTPRTHEPIFQETCSRIGLNPYLFEMANVRDQCSWVHSLEPELATKRAMDQIRMAVSRSSWLQPLPKKEINVEQAVMVVGGGMAGIQSALSLDAQGIPVYLVEKERQLGGRMRMLETVVPDNKQANVILNEKLAELKNTNVHIYVNTDVTKINGYIGNFEVETTNASFKVGAIILAFGADVYKPTGEFQYGKMKNVLTNYELEKLFTKSATLKINTKPVKRVAFIQCVGSRDPERHSHCSRICCDITVKQATKLVQQGKNISVFYRDMRTVGHEGEEMYRQSRGLGVRFIRYPDDKKPVVKQSRNSCKISAFDTMLGRDVEMNVDAVILATGMIPSEAQMAKFKELLKITHSPDGFLMERHPKLGPVETFVDGVFACGCVQSPQGIGDSMAQANAAAAKAAILVSRETIDISPTTCVVNEEKCRGCGQCVSICEFHAPELIEKNDGVYVATINEAMCKGCGTCAAWCPTDAIIAKHFTDRQIESMLDAMLTDAVKFESEIV